MIWPLAFPEIYVLKQKGQILVNEERNCPTNNVEFHFNKNNKQKILCVQKGVQNPHHVLMNQVQVVCVKENLPICSTGFCKS